MQKIIRKLFVISLLFCFILTAQAQQKTIKGFVTTFDSIVVVGAKVKIKSTKEIVATDSLGRFTAIVDNSDKLKVYAHGFIPQNVKLDEKTKVVAVNLKLKPGEKAREYAIGYGHVTDSEKLNAVAQLTNNDADFSQYATIYELIRGRFAGVTVLRNGDIVIRGPNSIMADNSALIVIDGITTDKNTLSGISPTNVKSINVIKDGSASIYGSRGANGVLIIETKSGMD